MRAQLLTNETLLGVIRCCPLHPPPPQKQQQQKATRKSLNHRHWLNICVLFLVLSGVWLLFCFCPALLLFFRACVFHWQRSGDARPPFASSGLSTYFRPYWDAFSVGRSVCFFSLAPTLSGVVGSMRFCSGRIYGLGRTLAFTGLWLFPNVLSLSLSLSLCVKPSRFGIRLVKTRGRH